MRSQPLKFFDAFLLWRQVGLNGVDNGAIRFTHVHVPRDNLLDRFASVDRSGAELVLVPACMRLKICTSPKISPRITNGSV